MSVSRVVKPARPETTKRIGGKSVIGTLNGPVVRREIDGTGNEAETTEIIMETTKRKKAAANGIIFLRRVFPYGYYYCRRRRRCYYYYERVVASRHPYRRDGRCRKLNFLTRGRARAPVRFVNNETKHPVKIAVLYTRWLRRRALVISTTLLFQY